MTIDFTFKVNKIETAPSLDGLTNVVTRVRYDYIGEDEDGNEGTFSGVTPMPAPDAENYTPLADLTEADVVSWLEAVADKAHMQERITKQIQNKVAPKYVDTPLPWAPAEEVSTQPVTP
jgi:hypothetical protein